ncbi:MAG: LuxR C-terminal-related transcriptional regulator [Cellulomonas sp.]|nr:LuxR C-terminal-related transcriptional regulator [Cellulomonas sp.]
MESTLGPWAPLPWFMTTAPSARRETITRPRLVALFDESVLAAPLTLVCAPSGYGKTVGAGQWAQGRARTGWLSGTSSAEAAALIRGGVLTVLPPALRQRVLTVDPNDPSPTIASTVAEMDDPVSLVIDDAHLLGPDALRTLLGSEPVLASGMLRLVLLGNASLEHSFARELVTGDARVVTARDLAFTSDEIAHAADLEGEGLLAVDSATLERETGGWPVAVRLRILASWERQRDGVPLPRALSSDEVDPLLTDYIEQSLLSGMPGDVASFVLDATTMSRLDVRLAEALTGRDDSASMLERCASDGLFLDRYVDPARGIVYRWHDAFAAHSRALLERRDPSRARELNLLAANLLARTFPVEALSHAVRVGAGALAVEIIRRSWLRLILESETRTLERMCLALPVEFQEIRDVLLIRACCRDLLLDPTGSEMFRARAAAVEGPGEGSFVQRFTELLLAPDPRSKSAAADAALVRLRAAEPGNDYVHGLFLLGWSEVRLRRDPARAIELLRSAVVEAENQRLASLAGVARSNLAFALTFAGSFTEAQQLLEELNPPPAEPVGDWDRFEGGLYGFSQGYLRYWRGELQEALTWFDTTVTAGGLDTSFAAIARVHSVLCVAQLRLSERYDEAEHSLAAVSTGYKHGMPWGSYRRIAAAHLLEAQGAKGRAMAVLEPLLQEEVVPASDALAAELFRRGGQPGRALAFARKLRPAARPAYVHVSALATLAALAFADGRRREAFRTLDRALTAAAHERLYRPFLADDQVFSELLETYASSGTPHERRMSEIFRLRTPAPAASRLTRREQELLGYLRTTMTAQEIAAELHVSLATVKTHIRSIYQKLGVNSRRGAVRSRR